MSVSLPSHVIISPDVLFEDVDDETILLDLHEGLYYGLDDVGTRAWQLLAEHGDVSLTLERMVAEYDVDRETLQRDLADLIADLADVGLLTLDSA